MLFTVRQTPFFFTLWSPYNPRSDHDEDSENAKKKRKHKQKDDRTLLTYAYMESNLEVTVPHRLHQRQRQPLVSN